MKQNTSSERLHYWGLLAKWYDKLLELEKGDIRFYKDIVLGCEGKVLELACGTGRLLIPFREESAEIEGLDISRDMLTICRKKLLEKNLTAKLYEQNLIDFNLEEQYELIFISGGSFQLIDDSEKILKSLRAVHKHLKSGGQFVLDMCNPLQDRSIPDKEGWHLIRKAEWGPDDVLNCYEKAEFDQSAKIKRGRYRYEYYKGDRLVERVEDGLDIRWYDVFEFKQLLLKAGFKKVDAIKAKIMSHHREETVFFAYK
jgi:SAM-dependent methyltransferase